MKYPTFFAFIVVIGMSLLYSCEEKEGDSNITDPTTNVNNDDLDQTVVNLGDTFHQAFTVDPKGNTVVKMVTYYKKMTSETSVIYIKDREEVPIGSQENFDGEINLFIDSNTLESGDIINILVLVQIEGTTYAPTLFDFYLNVA